MRLFVGNLHILATETELADLFSRFGKVTSVTIAYDKFVRRSRGYAYVVMDDAKAARLAMVRLHNTCFMDQFLVIKESGSNDMPSFGVHY